MTEFEYIADLKARWPRNEDAPLTTIALVDEAVGVFPQSPRLWCMRGSLIQLGPPNGPHSLDDALASYKRAIQVDPSFVEAWEEIGHFYDKVLDDESTAQSYFREAERLKGQNAQQSKCTEPRDDTTVSNSEPPPRGR